MQFLTNRIFAGRLLWLFLLPLVFWVPASRAADTEVTLEQTKAAVLLRISEFTTWPSNARITNGGGRVVGILNSPGLLAAAKAFVAADPKDRTVVIAVDSLEKAAACNTIYVGKLDELAKQALSGARSKPILTVGEGPEFIKAGGIIGFVFRSVGEEVSRDYLISVPAMDEANIRIDPRIVKKGIKAKEAR